MRAIFINAKHQQIDAVDISCGSFKSDETLRAAVCKALECERFAWFPFTCWADLYAEEPTPANAKPYGFVFCVNDMRLAGNGLILPRERQIVSTPEALDLYRGIFEFWQTASTALH